MKKEEILNLNYLIIFYISLFHYIFLTDFKFYSIFRPFIKILPNHIFIYKYKHIKYLIMTIIMIWFYIKTKNKIVKILYFII